MGMWRYGFEVSPLVNAAVPAKVSAVLGLMMNELERSMAWFRILLEKMSSGVQVLVVPPRRSGP